VGEGVGEEGEPERSLLVRDTHELFGGGGRLRREPVGQRFLPHLENVDGEPIGAAKGLVALGVVRHADEHQGWVEGNRGEGAGREPRRTACGIAGRHDGHSAREVTQHTPEIVSAQHDAFLAGPGIFFNLCKGLDDTRAGRLLDGPRPSPL
jgi:hypothetical protein